MKRDECYVCGEPLDLFSRDTFTGQLCHFCFNKQPKEWQEKIKSNKNNFELIQNMINELKEKVEKEKLEEARLSEQGNPTAEAEDKNENEKPRRKVKKQSPEKKKKKAAAKEPETEKDRFYYQKDMKDEEIEEIINHRVFIMDKLRYFAEVEDPRKSHEIALLDMIRHQMEILINQNELILRQLKKSKK